MNGKFALALILTLQVSLSLAEIPTPSPELLAKYETNKAVFYNRLINAVSKLKDAVVPVVNSMDKEKEIKAIVDFVENSPRIGAVVKLSGGLADEATPVVNKIRLSALGIYEKYLRPHIGQFLDQSMTDAKFFLDKILPAE